MIQQNTQNYKLISKFIQIEINGNNKVTMPEGQLLSTDLIRNTNSFTRKDKNLMRNCKKLTWNVLKNGIQCVTVFRQKTIEHQL